MNRIPLIIIIACFFSVKESSAQALTDNYPSENQLFELVLIDDYTLTEENEYLANINDIEALGRDTIYISTETEPGLVRYTGKGQNQVKISAFGQGPFEYSDPSVIKIHEDNLYIWDSSLKLLSYDLNNNPVKESKKFRWSFGDIAITDEFLFAYNDGKSQGKPVQKMSLNDMEVKAEYGFINKSHAFYKMYSGSGAITYHDENVYFVYPSDLKLYKINVKSGSVDSTEIADEDFVNVEVNNPREIIRNDREKILEYMRNASIVSDIFALDNYLVVQAQVGEMTYLKEQNAYSAISKKTKFYILDYSSLELVDTISFSSITNLRPQLQYWTSNGRELIHITEYPLYPTPERNWTAYYFRLKEN